MNKIRVAANTKSQLQFMTDVRLTLTLLVQLKSTALQRLQPLNHLKNFNIKYYYTIGHWIIII